MGTNKSKKLSMTELLDLDQPYSQHENIIDTSENRGHHDPELLQRFQGSIIGLAVGDALGAPVEFRPYKYVKDHPVTDMMSGGTWGLEAGQWTDDTSMALCLAASLIVKKESDLFDQLTRYLKWYRKGYLSSKSECFDIGNTTRLVLEKFESLCQMTDRADKSNVKIDGLGDKKGAGNGALMRIAPLALFYSSGSIGDVIRPIKEATIITHADKRAIDACCFFGVLICAAAQGKSKETILDPNYFNKFYTEPIHPDVKQIIEGSYKRKKGYDDGIRGQGLITNTLEAALWAFYHDGGDFNKGVLDVIALGDDTDTTAAVYGQLAGAYYGLHKIRREWTEKLFQSQFIKGVATELFYASREKFNQ